MYQTQKHIAFSFDLNNSIEGKLNVCDSNPEKIVSWEKSIIFTIYPDLSFSHQIRAEVQLF